MSDPLADLARLEGVPSALAAARDAVDAVLRDRGRRRFSPEVQTRVRVAGARASAELSGDPDRWLVGSLRLSAELPQLASLVRVAPAQVLARSHTLLARGVASDDQLGRTSLPEAGEGRLGGLLQLLVGSTAAPSLLLAAVAHAEVASVRPFGDASGLVARAVERLVLVQAGIDPQAVVAVETGHLASGAAYRARLADYQSGTAAGVGAWIRHCADAVTYGAEQLALEG
ncbi:MAG: hypothetical protein JWP61_1798 [Friedmanniella sp.]|nr:hypothetical protein [Friedmanniella sp.]